MDFSEYIIDRTMGGLGYNDDVNNDVSNDANNDATNDESDEIIILSDHDSNSSESSGGRIKLNSVEYIEVSRQSIQMGNIRGIVYDVFDLNELMQRKWEIENEPQNERERRQCCSQYADNECYVNGEMSEQMFNELNGIDNENNDVNNNANTNSHQRQRTSILPKIASTVSKTASTVGNAIRNIPYEPVVNYVSNVCSNVCSHMWNYVRNGDYVQQIYDVATYPNRLMENYRNSQTYTETVRPRIPIM